jgi:hypothetical protein
MANAEKSKILWDEATMRDIRSDSFTVTVSREEISLLFGTSQLSSPEEPAETVRIENRIILSPFTARQLAALLDRVIGEYEAAFGPLQKPPVQPGKKEGKEKAAGLFSLVRELDVEIGLENSFKMLDKTLLDNRFLLGFSKKEIEHNAHPRIMQTCKKLGMPQPLQETFRQTLFDANYVHFGFEETVNSCIYKVYVEFWDRIREEIRSSKDPARPFLLHLGFKWDAFDSRRMALTKYTWHPWLSVPEIEARLEAILGGDSHRTVLDAAKQITEIAAARTSHQDILYLEVSEDGNPRKSFDINVYRAGLQVGELYPFLSGLGQNYAVSHTGFHDLYHRIREKRFGHISGGVGRDGKDFCTIYYGVEPVYGDRLRQDSPPGDSMIAPTRMISPRQKQPTDPPIEMKDGRARLLLEKVKKLGVPFGLERSFKMAEGIFLPDRFLAGFRTGGMDADKRQEVMQVCREIEMPADFLACFEGGLPAASIALFGFEKNERSSYYKLYLEFNDRMKEAFEKNPAAPSPFQMFIGYKWDISDNARKVVTNYTCFPGLVLKEMAQRAAGLFYGRQAETPFRIVEGILDVTSHRAAPHEFLYFEAKEEGTERSSFSINLYRADVRMAEIYPLLLEMARYYAAPKEAFQRMYEGIKNQKLGNLAGGTDREGRDFLTLYFSEKGTSRRAPPEHENGH